MIHINPDSCIQCLNCSKVCPLKAIASTGGAAKFNRPDNCISCGHCVSVCPSGAVTADFTDSLPGKEAKSLDLPSFEQVEDFMLSRRSIRAYDSRKVEEVVIQKILRIAAHAPTGRNTQDVSFIVFGEKGSSELERLAQAYFLRQPGSNLARIIQEADYRVLLGAPVTIGLYTKKGAGVWNCAIAAQNLVLAAHSLGLGTCYNGILNGAYNNDEEIREYIGLPPEYEMRMFIVMGYPEPSIKYNHTIERKKPKVIWKD